MTLPPGYARVTPSRKCPICGDHHWCVIGPGYVYCCRVADGSDKYVESFSAHRHRSGDGPGVRKARIETPRKEPDINPTKLQAWYQQSLTHDKLVRLCGQLKLPEWSLQAMEVGWSPEHKKYSFPMADWCVRKTGFRLRSLRANKTSVYGSTSGLFIPLTYERSKRLWLCEGPTDTAALVSIGLNVIGRPSAKDGHDHIVRFVEPKCEVVILCDNPEGEDGDGGVGLEGAERTAQSLRLRKHPVTIIHPPDEIKDARAWVNAGATRHDIEHLAGVMQ